MWISGCLLNASCAGRTSRTADRSGDQPARQEPRFFFDLAERPSQVALVVDNRLVVRQGFGQAGEQLADRDVTKGR